MVCSLPPLIIGSKREGFKLRLFRRRAAHLLKVGSACRAVLELQIPYRSAVPGPVPQTGSTPRAASKLKRCAALWFAAGEYQEEGAKRENHSSEAFFVPAFLPSRLIGRFSGGVLGIAGEVFVLERVGGVVVELFIAVFVAYVSPAFGANGVVVAAMRGDRGLVPFGGRILKK